MLENPIALAALICFMLGLALSSVVRIFRCSTVASTVLPIIFLASYVVTYQQVPAFPPVGSTNKIFYIALAATVVGLVVDLLPRTATDRRLLAVITPLRIVGWIGYPRFAKPDIELIATALGSVARWHCLVVAPGYHCDGGARAQWWQYRRYRDVDGASARLRAGGIARRLFDQLNAVSRGRRWPCGRRAVGDLCSERCLRGQRRLGCRVRTSCNDRYGNVDHAGS